MGVDILSNNPAAAGGTYIAGSVTNVGAPSTSTANPTTTTTYGSSSGSDSTLSTISGFVEDNVIYIIIGAVLLIILSRFGIKKLI
jgi:hypothetical protein